jgi:hypothetical protein
VAWHRRDWDARLTLFLLAYRAFTHETRVWTQQSLVFGRELRLPWDLLFGTPINKKRLTIEHGANLVDHLHDTYNYARQHLKLASDRIKTRYDKLANCAGYHERQRWLYRPSSNPVGGPIQGGHPDKWSDIQGPAERKNEVHGVLMYRLLPCYGAARDEPRGEWWDRSQTSQAQPSEKKKWR